MTNLTQWAPFVLPYVPVGVPTVALQHAVRQGAINFCKDTHVWLVELDRINVVADTATYTLSLPSTVTNAIISGIKVVKYKLDGEDDDQFVTLDPISTQQADREVDGNWEFVSSSAPTNFWYDEKNTQIGLYPIPTEASASGLLVKVICVPSSDATSVPDFLFDLYRNEIAYGALSILFSQTGMPWANIDLATRELLFFEDATAKTKMKMATGNTERPLSVKLLGDTWL